MLVMVISVGYMGLIKYVDLCRSLHAHSWIIEEGDGGGFWLGVATYLGEFSVLNREKEDSVICEIDWEICVLF